MSIYPKYECGLKLWCAHLSAPSNNPTDTTDDYIPSARKAEYGMIANDVSNTETVRNVYFIDPEGIIRLILVYPLNVGRCIPEILRALEALQIADSCHVATPANWTLGSPLINPIPHTFPALKERVESIQENQNGMSWYLSFQNPKDCKENQIESKEIKQLKT